MDDASLAYEVRGTGEPLLLIPGWTQSLHTWDEQVGALSQYFRVIRFDRGPFGLNTDPVDALALLDHLGIRDFAVLGHSVGAATALRLALHAPSRVKALVIYGPPSAPGLTLPWNGMDSWPAHLQRLGIRSDLGTITREHGVDSVLALARSHPLFAIPASNTAARRQLDGIWSTYEGLDLRPAPAGAAQTKVPEPGDLASLSMPVLIATGTTEVPYFRLAADALHYAIPRSERAVIEGGGHMVHLIAPENFNRVISAFLRSALNRQEWQPLRRQGR